MACFYPILHVLPGDVVGDEQLGTKTKFWFERDGARWLFKEAREIIGGMTSGEDWSEKVAAEIAVLLKVPAARVELAEYQGRPGCASKNFTSPSQQLMHGNEILAGQIEGYDRGKRFRQSGHTLENIIKAVRGMFPKEEEMRCWRLHTNNS